MKVALYLHPSATSDPQSDRAPCKYDDREWRVSVREPADGLFQREYPTCALCNTEPIFLGFHDAEPQPSEIPLHHLAKVAQRIDYEVQRAEKERRPATTWAIAVGLYEGGFLAAARGDE